MLDVLATAMPDWVLVHARPEWVERYQGRTDEVRLPKSKEAQLQLAETIGADGQILLAAVYGADAPRWLREVPAWQLERASAAQDLDLRTFASQPTAQLEVDERAAAAHRALGRPSLGRQSPAGPAHELSRLRPGIG